jgi:hypothetical protein
VTLKVQAIDIGYSMPRTRLVMLENFMTPYWLYPDRLNINDLQQLFNFFVFFKQNRMELIRAFKEAAKDPRFIRDKAFLDSLVEQLENEMKKYCNLFKDNFTKEQPIIGKLYPYIKPMIDQYTTKK